MPLLKNSWREKINKEVEKSKKENTFVNKQVFTQFCDKMDVLIKSFSFSLSKTELCSQLIEELKNNVAHASEYVATQEEARNVYGIVGNLVKLRKKIKAKIWDIAGEPKSEKSPSQQSE